MRKCFQKICKFKRSKAIASQASPDRNDSNSQTTSSTSGYTQQNSGPGKSSDDEQEVDYDIAFEQAGEGIFNHIATVSCTFIFVHSLIEMIAIAYIIDPMECDLDLSVMQKTLVGSSIFMGVIFTAIGWGVLGDTYGRKKVMLPALFATIVCSFISSLCTVFWTMFVMRLITGALVSASSATVLVYLGELHTIEHRDSAISYALTAASAAFCLVPVIAWGIIPGTWSFNLFGLILIKPWRVFMWVFGVCGLIGAIILIFLPESPSYVVAHQGERAAIPILAKIYRYNHMKDPHIFRVKHLKVTSHENVDSACKTAMKEIVMLFRAPIRRPFLITHYCMFMVFLLANGVYLWMPGIFNLVLQDTTLPWTICTAIKSRYSTKDDFVMVPHSGSDGIDCSTGAINTMIYPMAIAMEFVLLVPFVTITIIIEKFNKCFLYAGIMIPCSVGLATCVLVPQIVVAGVVMTIGICSGAAASVLSALAVDAFPTSLRALVMCTMYMMGQFGAILGNTFVGIAASGPCEVIFFFLSALNVGSILSILLLWPDLKEVRRIMEERHFTY